MGRKFLSIFVTFRGKIIFCSQSAGKPIKSTWEQSSYFWSPGLAHQPVDLDSKHFRLNTKIIPNLPAHVVISRLTQTGIRTAAPLVLHISYKPVWEVRRASSIIYTVFLIKGYQPIFLAYTDGFKGIALSSSSNDCFIDATVGASDWWWCVGAYKYHGEQKYIPGPMKIVNLVTLYVNVDHMT